MTGRRYTIGEQLARALAHIYEGLCPTPFDRSVRDPQCQGCRTLLYLEKLLISLGMEDIP